MDPPAALISVPPISVPVSVLAVSVATLSVRGPRPRPRPAACAVSARDKSGWGEVSLQCVDGKCHLAAVSWCCRGVAKLVGGGGGASTADVYSAGTICGRQTRAR